MQVIWAEQALTGTGWQRDVRVEIADDGKIETVDAGRPREGEQVGILLPSPANAHSHAFQRAMAGLTERRGPDPRDTFWTWRRLMYRFLDRLTPEHVEAIAAFVQMEMLEAGYSANVEFHYLHHQRGGQPYDRLSEMSDRIVAAAAQTGISLTLLPVHYQFGGCDKRGLEDGQSRFGTDIDLFTRLFEDAKEAVGRLPADARIGVAAHSLRAVAPEALPLLPILAAEGPIHMHLAEQVAEVEETQAAWGKRPVEWLLDNADVGERWCLIHCTQMEPHETRGLARTGAVVGLCPITESSLGDGIFDGVRWLDAGGRIAVGSDSNVRIALSEELRTLDYSQRLRDRSRAALASAEKSTGRRLFDLVVQGGAQTAGSECEGIAAGSWCSLLSLDQSAVDLVARTGDTILDSFIFAADDRLVDNVWSAGRHVVKDGIHVHRDAIVARYLAAVGQLADAL